MIHEFMLEGEMETIGTLLALADRAIKGYFVLIARQVSLNLEIPCSVLNARQIHQTQSESSSSC